MPLGTLWYFCSRVLFSVVITIFFLPLGIFIKFLFFDTMLDDVSQWYLKEFSSAQSANLFKFTVLEYQHFYECLMATGRASEFTDPLPGAHRPAHWLTADNAGYFGQ
jgi:hypothetical protein